MKFDKEDFEGASIPGLLVTACGVMFFLGGGAVLLGLSSQDWRGHTVETYDDSVQAWHDVYYPEFKKVELSINITTSWTPEPAPWTFEGVPANENPEPLRDPIEKDITPHTPHRYVRTGEIYPSVNWTSENHFDWQVNVNISDGGVSHMVSSGVLQFLSTTTNGGPLKVCHNERGSWINSKCELYKKIKTVCLAVVKVDGKWQLDQSPATGGVGGCVFATKTNTFAMYDTERVNGKSITYGGGYPPEGLIDMSGLQVLVRHAKDPYIVATKLTQGSLNFGATANAKFWAGLSLFLVGLLLCIPFVLFCYQAVRMSVEEKRYETLIEEDYQDRRRPPSGPRPVTVSAGGGFGVGPVSRGENLEAYDIQGIVHAIETDLEMQRVVPVSGGRGGGRGHNSRPANMLPYDPYGTDNSHFASDPTRVLVHGKPTSASLQRDVLERHRSPRRQSQSSRLRSNSGGRISPTHIV